MTPQDASSGSSSAITPAGSRTRSTQFSRMWASRERHVRRPARGGGPTGLWRAAYRAAREGKSRQGFEEIVRGTLTKERTSPSIPPPADPSGNKPGNVTHRQENE